MYKQKVLKCQEVRDSQLENYHHNGELSQIIEIANLEI
jgi:hypothetical protein